MDANTTSGRIAYLLEDDDSIVGAYRAALDINEVQLRHYSSSSDFFADITEDPRGGCLLVDLQLADESGLDFITTIRRQGWTIPAVIISGELTVPTAMNAVEHGVFGVLEKPVSAKQLIATVEMALKAPRPTRQHTRAELEALAADFTKVEREVLAMMLRGKMNKVIASRLDISLRSVVRHRKRILDCLGFSNDMELAREWALAGLDSPVLRIAPLYSDSAQKEIRNRLEAAIAQFRLACPGTGQPVDVAGIQTGIARLIELKDSAYFLSAAELNKRNADLPLVLIMSDTVQETLLLGNLFHQNHFITKVCRTPAALINALRSLTSDTSIVLLLNGPLALDQLESLAGALDSMDCKATLHVLALVPHDSQDVLPCESVLGNRMQRIFIPYDPQSLVESALEVLAGQG